MRISEILVESKEYVYRIDSQPIADFSKDMKTYYHNKDFSKSGSYFKGATGKVTGLYAHPDRLFTALYTTGSSHDTRYVATYSTNPPVVYFDKKDVPKLQSNVSYLTIFDAKNFRKLPSGEVFSENPGTPVNQEKITDPFSYIQKQGWHIKIVDDLAAKLKEIKKTAKAQGIKFGAEGF